MKLWLLMREILGLFYFQKIKVIRGNYAGTEKGLKGVIVNSCAVVERS
jgi:hypothetical protein